MKPYSLRHKLRDKAHFILEHAEPNIPIMGVFGLVGFPLFFAVWKYIFPQEFESLPFRMFIALLSIPWALYHYLPRLLRSHFHVYMLISCWFMIPFFFFFMLLKNEFSMVWTMSAMAGLFLLILLINDWLLVVIYTVTAYIGAYLTIVVLDGNTAPYSHFQMEYIPLMLFGIVGGLIFSHQKHIASLSRIALLKSLSGSIAHEMRNPLNSIKNAMSSLQVILPEKPAHSKKDADYTLSRSALISLHNVIEENTATIHSANKIIDSILANMQGKAVDVSAFRKISARKTLSNAVDSFSFKTNKERSLVIVTSNDEFHFLGDKDLFQYVVFNLLKNALYYKEKKGFKIEISTRTTKAGNQIRFFDTGPGIPAKKLDKIFDSFYTSGKRGGIGLGLAFCRRVIESFGGRISCRSQEHQWTEFIISLPHYDSAVTTGIKKAVLKHKRVLVTDDNPVDRLRAEKLLSEWGCMVHTAENGLEAVEQASGTSFDMILMDMEMPVLAGDDAARQIRSGQLLHIPIIAVTSLDRQQALEKVASANMSGLIRKPIRKEDIEQVFEQHIFPDRSPDAQPLNISLDKPSILVVDDNLTSRKFLSIIIQRLGADVFQAENGREAIDILEQHEIDLVFMDMEMPVMNGIEATLVIRSGKKFKRFKKFSTIPIIALTGNTDKANIDLACRSGMNAHLGKPVSQHMLAKIFSTWLPGYVRNFNADPSQTPNSSIMDDLLNEVHNQCIINDETIDSLRETGGDELLEQLIGIYLEDTKKIIDGIIKASTDGDTESINRLSHTLKGSSGSVGAQKMHILATHLNQLAKSTHNNDYSDWISTMQETFSETMKEFQTLRNTP
ncbi:hybrid sensor histidine kinase/response regulator [Prosthecochloris sp. HL-130-GSB]|jgi:two-component system, CAI-1 autoinducer sensor kinase/phosphatase CqsS|uniref:ATP-binding response regulator n=1 Tax=Prosthecochloris sp. HL-130-GSB TaxID=1974213 RepID=UPI000A1C11EE|nr:hybrid sensor histidine kinase/response regulator [Prosthecochloris sp. HL-130-GSB]ARM31286.1 hypothetical protein B9H02_08260 [Prosthecochloris sp. HL-130-GSB]